jgi:hypothetical protein
VIGPLSDEHHERLWRICDALVSGAGARAAMICDTSSGEVLVSVGDTSATGAVSGMDALGPGERLVRGEGGQIYGVDVPGGALLAVLHEVGALDNVRALAAEAVHDAAELLASLAPADRDREHDHDREHDREDDDDRDNRDHDRDNRDRELDRDNDRDRARQTQTTRAARKKPAPKHRPVAKQKAAARKKKGAARKLKPSRKRRR